MKKDLRLERKAGLSRRLFWFLLLLATLGLAGAALVLGSVSIPLGRIPEILLRSGAEQGGNSPEAVILLQLRLPRIIAAFLVGGALSVAGTLFQGLFRNPLVEPYTLGVSGGATVLIGLGILIFGPDVLLLAPLLGFLGAVGAVSLAVILTGRSGRLGVERLLLIGVMISFVCSAALVGLVSVAGLDRFRGLLYWTMGSLAGADPAAVAILLPVVGVSFALALGRAWALNALALGEENAAGLGYDPEREKRLIILLGSLLAGVSVAVAGVIGFVGLLVPHLLRRLVGGDHRVLLPAALVGGGFFLLACDTLARTAFSAQGIQFPVGAVTGLLGGVIFIALLSARRAR